VLQGFELLEATVVEALSGHRCVSGWLGYGSALFLGFGSEQLPERDANDRRTEPPYELQTSMAGWRVGGATSADSESEREAAEGAVRALVGRSVVRWRLIDRGGLVVEFAGGCRLEVLPPSEVDPERSDLDDEWWFCMPGSRYVGVGGGGRVIEGRTDQQPNVQDAEPGAAADGGAR
jgi:hypothetical protein